VFKFRLFAFAGAAAILDITLPAMAEDNDMEVRLTPKEVAKVPTRTAGTGTSGLPAVTTTVLFGDPSKPGLYTIDQAHTHRDTRSALVLSGLWYFGYGLKNEKSAVKALPFGSFYTEPGGQAHFARTRSKGAVVVITGYGPSDTVYVN
jgi:hypothetical protein